VNKCICTPPFFEAQTTSVISAACPTVANRHISSLRNPHLLKYRANNSPHLHYLTRLSLSSCSSLIIVLEQAYPDIIFCSPHFARGCVIFGDDRGLCFGLGRHRKDSTPSHRPEALLHQLSSRRFAAIKNCILGAPEEQRRSK
jgi:hypothetical protein